MVSNGADGIGFFTVEAQMNEDDMSLEYAILTYKNKPPKGGCGVSLGTAEALLFFDLTELEHLLVSFLLSKLFEL